MLVPDLLTGLEGLPEGDLRDSYIQFVRSVGDAALRREGGPEHLTASCFVFSPEFDHVLLCFHRKGQFWLQFGGHIEPGDRTVADAAQREAREESGISDLELLSPAIIDLDRHDLHAGFSCAAHWDVVFTAVAPRNALLSVSEESEDVRWFPIDDLPANVPPGWQMRVGSAARAASSLAEEVAATAP